MPGQRAGRWSAVHAVSPRTEGSFITNLLNEQFEYAILWSRTWGRGADVVATQSFEWCFNRLILAGSRQSGRNVNPPIATLGFRNETVMVSRFANGRNPRLLPEWAVSVMISQPSLSIVAMCLSIVCMVGNNRWR